MTAQTDTDAPEFPLTPTEDAGDGPCHRQAFEIGGGALVIRSTDDGHAVCLKLDRVGKEYIHHYLLVLDPQPEGDLELVYVDPEEKLFDCFATLDLDLGEAENVEPQPGHAFENKDGQFIMALDDPKTQKMHGFAEPASGLVRIRQNRKVKAVHPNWRARAKIQDDILELSDLLERFAKDI